jgi:Fe-S cluster assembly scaffold protein SufB
VKVSPFSSQEIQISEEGIHSIEIHDFSEESYDSTVNITAISPRTEIFVSTKIHAFGSAQKNITIRVTLQNSDQKAYVDVKAIVDDRALLKLNGGIKLEKNSSQSSAEVHEKVVLFSPHARAIVTPGLKVETHDVLSASHSASIAPFSEELFFFLASRGISKSTAKKMLMEGMMEL